MPLLFVLLSLFSYAAPPQNDFKGLFGSYRREQYIENEGLDNNIGINILVSTLFPVSSIVKGKEGTAETKNLHYATFFNLEAEFFWDYKYNWELFSRIGYYNYGTRKENEILTSSDPAQANLPLFHQFDMTAIPLIAGLKYRLGKEDIVPYVGAGAGISYVERKASFDYSVQQDKQLSYVFTTEVMAGLQFYFSSRAGLRLEMAAFYFNLPERTYDVPGASLPTLIYQSSPWLMRYASGLFVIF